MLNHKTKNTWIVKGHPEGHLLSGTFEHAKPLAAGFVWSTREHSLPHTVPPCTNEVPSWSKDWFGNDTLKRQHWENLPIFWQWLRTVPTPPLDRENQGSKTFVEGICDSQIHKGSFLSGYAMVSKTPACFFWSGTLVSPLCGICKVSLKMRCIVIHYSDRNCWPVFWYCSHHYLAFSDHHRREDHLGSPA